VWQTAPLLCWHDTIIIVIRIARFGRLTWRLID
jgi:hypothetical protein